MVHKVTLDYAVSYDQIRSNASSVMQFLSVFLWVWIRRSKTVRPNFFMVIKAESFIGGVGRPNLFMVIKAENLT